MNRENLEQVLKEFMLTIHHLKNVVAKPILKESKEYSMLHYYILHSLCNCTSATNVEVRKDLSLSKPHMSKVISELEEKGFIERTYSDKDRRVLELKVTKAGEYYVKSYKQLVLESFKTKISDLSDQEVDIMINSMKNIIELSKKFKS